MLGVSIGVDEKAGVAVAVEVGITVGVWVAAAVSDALGAGWRVVVGTWVWVTVVRPVGVLTG